MTLGNDPGSAPRQRTRLAPLVILAGLALMAPLMRFDANDDLQMMLWASGAGAGRERSADLMYVSPVLGTAMNWAYAWVPGIEWYGICLVGGVLVAALAMWTAIRTLVTGGGAEVLAAAGAVTILAFGALHLQYTRVSILLAFAGVALAVSRVRPAAAHTWRDPRLLVALAIIALAAMYRVDGAVLGVLLALPILFAQAIRHHDRMTAITGTVLVGAALLGVVGVRTYGVWFMRSTAERRASAEQLALIAPMTDLGMHRRVCAPQACADLVKVWSVNDIRLLDHFMTDDPQVFSNDNLKLVHRRLFPSGATLASRLRLRFAGVAGRPVIPAQGVVGAPAMAAGAVPAAPAAASSPPAPVAVGSKLGRLVLNVAFLALCLALVLVAAIVRTRAGVTALVPVCVGGGIVALLAVLTKFPPARVYEPVWLATAVSTVLVVVLLQPSRRAVTGATLALALASACTLLDAALGAPRHWRQRRAATATLGALAPELLVTSLSSAPAQDWWSPIGGNSTLNRHDWLILGWSSNLAGNRRAAARAGLDRPLIAAACGERASFIGDTADARSIVRFAEEHGARHCEMVVVDSVPRADRADYPWFVWKGRAVP
ncbi:MAG: hypothetical protein IT355_13605 [Gemmatimonadaceae bacterium]|nr:hypothetical protein [Gemmatimonadaceae bacterium]